MANQNQKQNHSQMQSPRVSQREDKNVFIVSKQLKDILTGILVVNAANVLAYNTGWINWKADEWDIMWASGLFVVNLIYPIVFNSVSKRN